MIRQVNKIGDLTAESFEAEYLVVYRKAPMQFDLMEVAGVASPHNCYLNTELSQQGAKALIEYIKALAIAETEEWTDKQKQEAREAQTIYICYFEFNNIFLNFSNEVLTKEQIQEANEGSDVWVSHNVSDLSLINLVNELINWL
jgi:hypothetical protein